MIADTGQGHRYTIAEFEAFIDLPENEARRFELVDGAIVETDLSEERGVLIGQVCVPIGDFVEKHDFGRVTLLVYCHAANDEYTALRPEVSFTRRGRLLPLDPEGVLPQIADLVVEVPSRDAKIKVLRAKK